MFQTSKKIEWADFKFPPVNLWIMPPRYYRETSMSYEDILLWELSISFVRDNRYSDRVGLY